MISALRRRFTSRSERRQDLEGKISSAVHQALIEDGGDGVEEETKTKRVAQLLLQEDGAGAAAAGSSPISEAAELVTAVFVDDMLKSLSFEKMSSAVFAPPRPSPTDVAAGRAASGTLAVHGGVVVQAGPHRAIYLRVGCVADVPWLTVWETLCRLLDELEPIMLHAAQEATIARRGGTTVMPGAVYLCISQSAAQAVNLERLAERGFQFYYYRHAPAEQSQARDSELVYYKWLGPEDKMSIPAYYTGYEGVHGIVLSPDMNKVLLLWEPTRKVWGAVGGHLDPGEVCRYMRSEGSNPRIVAHAPQRAPTPACPHQLSLTN